MNTVNDQLSVVRIERTMIARNWGWIAQLLAPAVTIDTNRTLEQVRDGLVRGEMGLASVRVPGGSGLVVVEPGVFDGVFALWLPYIVGRWNGGPKAFIRILRRLIAGFEAEARAAGCAEVRIGGRDYARIFPDYERFDDTPNRLRKVL